LTPASIRLPASTHVPPPFVLYSSTPPSKYVPPPFSNSNALSKYRRPPAGTVTLEVMAAE
jgi:hypothetical protein